MASDQWQKNWNYEEHQQNGEEREKAAVEASATMMMKIRGMDEKIWKACAGNLVRIPAVNSRAFYFPQGHVEQSSPLTDLTSLPAHITSRPYVPCRVLVVEYQADGETDEVFAKIRLQPVVSNTHGGGDAYVSNAPVVFQPPGGGGGGEGDGSGGGGGDADGGVVSFAKVLTPSDANNGGGFSVPRYCADAIFPALDFEADPPVQTIYITDVHGVTWEFRHIYRGTPRRHLLTTGWSKFVNSKKLIAGDSVVFIKNTLTHKLSAGVRRAYKSFNNNFANYGGAWAAAPGGIISNLNAANIAKEKVVVEAADKAVKGMVFEVVYYPKPGVPEFVVAAERVEMAMSMYWAAGVRVKMAMETEDSSRLQWFQGMVKAAVLPETGLFPGSPWRMLEVEWDEGDILKHMKTVNPWQVDYVPATPPGPAIHATFPPPSPPIHHPTFPPPGPLIDTTFPPTKKFRSSGMLTDGEGEYPLPNSLGVSFMMGHLSPSHFSFNSLPAGMQGARQSYNPSILSNTVIEGTHQMTSSNHKDNTSQNVEAISTDLNIGNSSSDTHSTSLDIENNNVQLVNSASSNQEPNEMTSFQLFGQTIHAKQPHTNTGEITCIDHNDNGAEGADNTMDPSSVDPYKKLHAGVEAFVKG